MNHSEKAGIQIGVKSFLTSAAILLSIMIFAGILTRVIPQGAYLREMVDGRAVVVADSFQYVEGVPLPVWRWFTAPFEVFLSSDAAMAIVIIFFLSAIGGSIAILDKSGMMKTLMLSITRRYRTRKYALMAVLVLCFMLFGATFGMFEESLALTPIAVALSYALGWDALVGIGMSALAAGFGFTCALTNPFTCGIAQRLAGLPVFSGILFRAVLFVIIYGIFYLFLRRYAKRIEADPTRSLVHGEDAAQRKKYQLSAEDTVENPDVLAAISIFKFFLLGAAAVITAGIVVPGITDLSLPLVAIIFLAGSFTAGRRAKYTRSVGRDFWEGLSGILPSILLISLAMAVKFIIEQGGIMDTVLHYASSALTGRAPLVSAVLIYGIVMVMEFFIGSGSAKAFLVIPIVAPLAELTGVTRQTAVLAFLFGDGFSNVIFPSNPVLMILLGITAVSYTKWLKWTAKLQLLLLAVSVLALLVATLIGYGPF